MLSSSWLARDKIWNTRYVVSSVTIAFNVCNLRLSETRKQLNEQIQCLEFRSESKLSLLGELKDFFKKRGEVEFEYAKNLERLCERFERNTKQRNLK